VCVRCVCTCGYVVYVWVDGWMATWGVGKIVGERRGRNHDCHLEPSVSFQQELALRVVLGLNVRGNVRPGRVLVLELNVFMYSCLEKQKKSSQPQQQQQQAKR